MMPIIPHLTDSDENLNALYSHGEDAKVSYALPGPSRPSRTDEALLFDFIRLEYPRLDPIFRDLYREGRLDQGNIGRRSTSASKIKRHTPCPIITCRQRRTRAYSSPCFRKDDDKWQRKIREILRAKLFPPPGSLLRPRV